MSKPPKSEPHSDIDGVHQDKRPGGAEGRETEEGGKELKQAEEESAGRPNRRDHRAG